MSIQIKSQKKTLSLKKTLLPFIVHRAPIENHIAYQKKGHWTQKEKLKYVIFLEYFKLKFTTRDKKKRFCRIFKLMSDFIKTRTHNQCRSHHQKMEKQRFQVDNIIKNVVSKYHPRVYKQMCEKYRIEIENLDFSDFHIKNNKIKTIIQLEASSKSQQEKNIPANLQFQKIQIEEKVMEKEAENSLPSFLMKNYEQNQSSFTLAFHRFKDPRPTRESDSDSQDSVEKNQPQCMNYTVQNLLPIQRQQSLDLNFNDNYYGFKTNLPINPSIQMSEYIQTLQIKKLHCLQRANFHYSQMQIELGKVGQCERQKQIFIQSQIQHIHKPQTFPFSLSNFHWGYSNFQKQC